MQQTVRAENPRALSILYAIGGALTGRVGSPIRPIRVYLGVSKNWGPLFVCTDSTDHNIWGLLWGTFFWKFSCGSVILPHLA